MLGVLKEIFGRRPLEYRSLIHEEDPIANFSSKTHFVSHAHHRHSIQGQILDDLQHFSNHLGIQGTGWFIKQRSEEHTSELQSLMRISYAVFCLKQKIINKQNEKISNR